MVLPQNFRHPVLCGLTGLELSCVVAPFVLNRLAIPNRRVPTLAIAIRVTAHWPRMRGQPSKLAEVPVSERRNLLTDSRAARGDAEHVGQRVAGYLDHVIRRDSVHVPGPPEP